MGSVIPFTMIRRDSFASQKMRGVRFSLWPAACGLPQAGTCYANRSRGTRCRQLLIRAGQHWDKALLLTVAGGDDAAFTVSRRPAGDLDGGKTL